MEEPDVMDNYDGQEVAWINRIVQSPGIDIGRIRYLPGGYCGPRRQRDFELVVVQTGSASVTVDRQTFVLPREQAVLFLPGHREHFVFSREGTTEHLWCSINPRLVPVKLRRSLNRAPRSVPCSELIHRIFVAALERRYVDNQASAHVVEHLGLALFSEFLHLASAEWKTARQDETLSRATACIDEHFGEEDCLARARTAARCSASGLNQRFRHFLGTSPARYLWHTRVERGMGMLRNTGLTVAEISERCGFKNPFHFSRLVTRAHGMPPREVRRQAWL